MTSLFPVICCDDVATASEFYVALLDLRSVFATDWYVQLQSPIDAQVQLGLVQREHPSVPACYRTRPGGVFVTIEVDDVDAVHVRAGELGLAITYALRDEPWGQRHFMTTDPNGLAVDVVKIIPPAPDFLQASDLA